MRLWKPWSQVKTCQRGESAPGASVAGRQGRRPQGDLDTQEANAVTEPSP